MRRQISRFAAAGLVVGVAFASLSFGQDAAPDKAPHAALLALKAEIEKIAKDRMPGAKFTFDRGQLVVEYQTRRFTVHSMLKTGAFTEDAAEQIGPDAAGIYVVASVLPGREYMGERMVPQTLREPYWMTDLSAHPIKDKNEHIFLAVSYGLRADKELVEAIKAAAATVAK
ncbi:MAG: hypothetical protein AB1696_20150 [Planctomycetota bacterium]